jgi:ABC-type amino acid transport system permease subunit
VADTFSKDFAKVLQLTSKALQRQGMRPGFSQFFTGFMVLILNTPILFQLFSLFYFCLERKLLYFHFHLERQQQSRSHSIGIFCIPAGWLGTQLRGAAGEFEHLRVTARARN